MSMFKTITGFVLDHELIPPEWEPGEVSFHHKNVVHGAFADCGVVKHCHNTPATSAAFAHRRADPVPWMYKVEKPVVAAERFLVR